MQVETFKCKETAAEPIEASEEAIRLIGELGLDGQSSLITKETGTNKDTRLPYQEATAEEMFVYQTICPVEVGVETYKESPMPLRVLQVLAHAKSTNYFDQIVVWDKASSGVLDPVLVGWKGEKYTPSRKCYLLARWGEVLEPYPVMAKQALAMWRERAANELKKTAAQCTLAISYYENMSLADAAEKRFDWKPNVYNI